MKQQGVHEADCMSQHMINYTRVSTSEIEARKCIQRGAALEGPLMESSQDIGAYKLGEVDVGAALVRQEGPRSTQ
jgi:hypothetical protein